MTLEELQKALLGLQNSLSAKGYSHIDVFASVGTEHTLFMTHYRINPNDNYDAMKRLSSRDFDDFCQQVHAILDLQEVKRQEFLPRLAHLVEDAEALGINIPHLRPLFEDYRNNLLEHHQ